MLEHEQEDKRENPVLPSWIHFDQRTTSFLTINSPYSLRYHKLRKAKLQKNEEEKNDCLFDFDGCTGLTFLLEVEANTICSVTRGWRWWENSKEVRRLSLWFSASLLARLKMRRHNLQEFHLSYPKRRCRSRYKAPLSLKLLLWVPAWTGRAVDHLQGGEKNFWEQVLILYRRQDRKHAKPGWLEWSLPLWWKRCINIQCFLAAGSASVVPSISRGMGKAEWALVFLTPRRDNEPGKESAYLLAEKRFT